jgi:hypothetical protein
MSEQGWQMAGLQGQGTYACSSRHLEKAQAREIWQRIEARIAEIDAELRRQVDLHDELRALNIMRDAIKDRFHELTALHEKKP